MKEINPLNELSEKSSNSKQENANILDRFRTKKKN